MTFHTQRIYFIKPPNGVRDERNPPGAVRAARGDGEGRCKMDNNALGTARVSQREARRLQ
jgi:hypothetical protein